MTTHDTPPTADELAEALRYPDAMHARTYIRRLTLDDLLTLQREFTRPAGWSVHFALLVQRQVDAMRGHQRSINQP